MLKKQLSKYVLRFPKENVILLYNTTNEAIAIVKKEDYKRGSIIGCDKEISLLSSAGFFDKNKQLLSNLIAERKKSRNTLIITLSMTQACNLNCVYCSQNDSKTSNLITKDNLDFTLLYIKKCILKKKYKNVAINFFGGEPLLAKKEILYFKSELEKIINANKISYSIVTNGVLLDKQFLAAFDKLNIKITLSEKRDHDLYRRFFDGSGSFDKITKNLKSCKNLFNRKIQVSLRYNVGNNFNTFEDFVEYIHSNFEFIHYIEIAPIIDYKFNKRTTSLSIKRFGEWYVNKAIDILLKHKMYIEFPTPVYSYCRVFAENSVKVFPDGALALCNAYNYNSRKYNIRGLSENIELLKTMFKNEKKRPINKKCLSCNKIFLCGGRQFCKKPQYCQFINYPLDKFIYKYYNYIGTNKEKYFFTISKKE